jgi:hypothetical protein
MKRYRNGNGAQTLGMIDAALEAGKSFTMYAKDTRFKHERGVTVLLFVPKP